MIRKSNSGNVAASMSPKGYRHNGNRHKVNGRYVHYFLTSYDYL